MTMRMPEKVKHGIIAARGKGKVTKYGSDTKLIRTGISPVMMITNQRKAALREKQDSKWHKIFSIIFNIVVWSSASKYDKLIFEITLLVDLSFLFWQLIGYHKTLWKGYFLLITYNSPVVYNLCIFII